MVPFEINWNLIYGLDENVSNGVNNYIGNKLDSFLSETRDTLKSTLSVFPSIILTPKLYQNERCPVLRILCLGRFFFQSYYLLAC